MALLKIVGAALLAVLVLVMSPGQAQVVDKKILTLEGAKQVIAAAVAEAKKHNAGGAIAVVDDGGNLMALERLDQTFAVAANIAIGKARTAAIFQRSTHDSTWDEPLGNSA